MTSTNLSDQKAQTRHVQTHQHLVLIHDFNLMASCFKESVINRPIYIPVSSEIANKKISCFLNVAQIMALATGIIYASYRSRLATPITFGSNMWMNFDPSTIKSIPTQCSNTQFDFFYDPVWVYNNISCRTETSSKMFIKGLEDGSYFVPTMIQKIYSRPCLNNTPPSTPADICFPEAQKRETSFVLGIDEAMLNAMVSLSVPALDFIDGDDAFTTPTEIILPNGTSFIHPRFKDAGMYPSLSVGDWVALFGLDDGLNGINEAGGVKVSVGNARHRHVGLSIEIRVGLSNTDSVFSFPSTNPDRLKRKWTISTKKSWTRIILQDTVSMDVSINEKNERERAACTYGSTVDFDFYYSSLFQTCCIVIASYLLFI